METLLNITSLTKGKEILEFYNQLSRTVRAINTMKKLQSAQNYVYSIMDRLGPVREVLVQKDDDWEEGVGVRGACRKPRGLRPESKLCSQHMND